MSYTLYLLTYKLKIRPNVAMKIKYFTAKRPLKSIILKTQLLTFPLNSFDFCKSRSKF